MPIVTDPGSASANSYISVAEADLYAAADVGLYSARWLDAALTNTARKEASLQRATRDIDTYIGAVFAPWSVLQALLFPRPGDLNTAGSPIIPSRLKRATYEQAVYVNANADIIDGAATRWARGLSNFSEQNVSGALADRPELGRLSATAVALIAGGGFEEAATVGIIVPT